MRKLLFITLWLFILTSVCSAGSTTTNYSLYKPAVNETGWGTLMNTSTDAIDTQMKANADDIDTNDTATALNTAHRSSDGSDHSDVVANSAKTTNATHTGEVTGSGALTISDGVTVDGWNLGNVNATTIIATTGTMNIVGNADTATALETARTIAGVSFDGTANINIASTGLSDTADLLYEAELNTFSELQTQIADETLLKAGTLTDTKYCIYDSASGDIICNSEGGGGAGDITAVGDCATGACFEGTAGTTITPSGSTLTIAGDLDVDGGITATAGTFTTLNITGTGEPVFANLTHFNGGLKTTASMTFDDDNIGVVFGAGQEASIYFDATDSQLFFSDGTTNNKSLADLASGGGGGGTPGGADGDIQYNNGGSFGGFGTYNDSKGTVTFDGDLDSDSITTNTATFSGEGEATFSTVANFDAGLISTAGSTMHSTTTGSGANVVVIDSAGEMTFGGAANIYIANGQYVFRAVADSDAGISFDGAGLVKFRDTAGVSVVTVDVDGADAGDLYVGGEVEIDDSVTGGGAGTDICIDSNNKLCACGSCG